jgi:hypothetical protein
MKGIDVTGCTDDLRSDTDEHDRELTSERRLN